ncbi:MAG: flavin prenyltransferase UbiX [Gemmatales bacterium]|nr:UbiX family flavin prenyltransferase [Gemmatales bacterium]MCS7160479.1 UbiX family flavin prenyltransferase [Gemmatales bacterium]MDW8175679.1 flavin prenyltransferase UbiX [Gemmatales bacterium]MDW8222464.1 flavin prenyltransferase UbiX [Gemmatales bacterium]
MSDELVVALTGASGAPYGVRLLEVLLAAGRTIHLTLSPAATQVLRAELGYHVDLERFDLSTLLPHASSEHKRRVHYHHYQNLSASISSGSFLTGGMVICPCSMGTLAAIAHGLAQNLIHRAAEVHLKERRRLILVPRETPYHAIHLHNMLRCTEAGAVILPASPAFYTRPSTIADMVDFIVGRICDLLKVPHQLFRRWGQPDKGTTTSPGN